MNYKETKYVQKVLALGLCVGLLLMYAVAAKADSIYVGTSYPFTYNSPSHGNIVVGPVGGSSLTINNIASPISGGITCLDFNTSTGLNTSFNVSVGTLSSSSVSSTVKFINDPNKVEGALLKYQQAAWLNGQMATHITSQSDVTAISFAIWSLFSSGAASQDPYSQNGQTNSWLTSARAIIPQNYDFSSVKIYTATNSINQEFMSGKASPVPIPGALFLFAPGLAGLVALRRRFIS